MTEPVFNVPIAKVLDAAQCSRATLYRWIAANKFPAPRKIGTGKNGRVRWCQDHINLWIAAR